MPQPLRHADLARLFPELLNQLQRQVAPAELCQWLCAQQHAKNSWTMAQASEVWRQLQAALPGDLATVGAGIDSFLQPLALEQQLDRWNHEHSL